MKISILTIVACILCGTQSAGAVSLNAIDSGVFLKSVIGGFPGGNGPRLTHDSDSTTISVSFYELSFYSVYALTDRNAYAIFDLSGITGTVTAASLEMSLTESNISSGSAGTFTFYEVTSDPTLFNSSYNEGPCILPWLPCFPPGVGLDIHQDLGDGVAFGSVTYTGLGSQTAILSSSAIDLVDLALGGLFVVGIDTDFAGINAHDENIFGSPQLILEIAPIPIPAAVWLLGSALISSFGFARRT